MTQEDILVAPLLFLTIVLIGFWVRNRIYDPRRRRYFLPFLVLKIVAALLLGVLYQEYYGGGDTFTYFTHGAGHIFQAFLDSPAKAFRLIFLDNDYQGHIYRYARQIWFYQDSGSYMIVRIAGLFSIFTFGTYAGAAILFAVFSAWGLWSMYDSFCSIWENAQNELAIAILFVPSVVFWGSGILKDTITIGAIGLIVSGIIRMLIIKEYKTGTFAAVAIGLFLIWSIKKYILIILIPAIMVWILLQNLQRLRGIKKLLLAPFLFVLFATTAFYTIDQITRNDPRYALNRLLSTSVITANDIGFYTGKGAGSQYSLGTPEASMSSMLSKSPGAINVTLFRPYLWEVNNPLMLISALESIIFLTLTFVAFTRLLIYQRHDIITNPTIVFCLLFSLTFALSIGISTYNFGTLVRYKIPLLPFYLIAILFLIKHAKSYDKSLRRYLP